VPAVIHDSELLYARSFQHDWRPVFRFLLAWINDWNAAEDLTQEAFVRLWQNRDRVNWLEPVLPWLLLTGRRLATDRFRDLRRHVLPTRQAITLDETSRTEWLDIQAASRRCPGWSGRP
jgi:DNA-directed RNA polymerase specialized sigma24 family protein